MVMDAGQDVGEVGLRIKAVPLGAFNQGHGLGEGLPTCIIAREEPVFATNPDRSHGTPGRIIIYGHATVGQEQAER